jgi:hypothetical protein
MNESLRLDPNTPEERQAVLTVKSAKDVLGEIGALSRLLSVQNADLGERVTAKRDLFEASDRMCNLMSLALQQTEKNLTGEIQQELTKEVNALRDRLLSIGTSLMVEKLRKIGDRVESVLREGNYPIGLSGKLGMAFSNLVSNLQVLGGEERLPEADRLSIDRTRSRLKQLEDIEHGLGLLSEVDRLDVDRRGPSATTGASPMLKKTASG